MPSNSVIKEFHLITVRLYESRDHQLGSLHVLILSEHIQEAE